MNQLSQFRDLKVLHQEMRTAIQNMADTASTASTEEDRMLFLAKHLVCYIPDRILRIKILRKAFRLSLRDAKDLSDMADWVWGDRRI